MSTQYIDDTTIRLINEVKPVAVSLYDCGGILEIVHKDQAIPIRSINGVSVADVLIPLLEQHYSEDHAIYLVKEAYHRTLPIEMQDILREKPANHDSIAFKRDDDEHNTHAVIGKYLGTVKLKFSAGKKKVMVYSQDAQQLIFIDVPSVGVPAIIGDNSQFVYQENGNRKKLDKLFSDAGLPLIQNHYGIPF